MLLWKFSNCVLYIFLKVWRPQFSKLLLCGNPYIRLLVRSCRCPKFLVLIVYLCFWTQLLLVTPHVFDHLLIDALNLAIYRPKTFGTWAGEGILWYRNQAWSSHSDVLLLNTVFLCRIVWYVFISVPLEKKIFIDLQFLVLYFTWHCHDLWFVHFRRDWTLLLIFSWWTEVLLRCLFLRSRW